MLGEVQQRSDLHLSCRGGGCGAGAERCGALAALSHSGAAVEPGCGRGDLVVKGWLISW